eukprot:351761-Chlamydomonas_euryale.AAC.3
MDAAELPGMPSDDGTPAPAITDDALEQLQATLLSTCWDGSADEARAARDALAALLRVPAPVMKAVNKGAGARQQGRDENESYAALLDDFARGL